MAQMSEGANSAKEK